MQLVLDEKKLEDAKRKAGINNKVLAERMRTSPTTINRMKRSSFRITSICSMADALGVHPYDLMTYSAAPETTYSEATPWRYAADQVSSDLGFLAAGIHAVICRQAYPISKSAIMAMAHDTDFNVLGALDVLVDDGYIKAEAPATAE